MKVSFEYAVTTVCVIFLISPGLKIKAQGYTTPNKKTIINCQISGLGQSNSLNIHLWGDVFGAYGKEKADYENSSVVLKEQRENFFKSAGKNDLFHFYWNNLTTPKYAALYSTNRSPKAKMIDAAFTIEPGDSIVITEKNDRLTFSGKNSVRYQCEYEIGRLERLPIVVNQPKDIPDSVLNYFERLDSIAKLCLQVLNEYQHQISEDNYWLIKGDIVEYFQWNKTNFFYWRGFLNGDGNNKYFAYFKNYKSTIWNNKINDEFSKNHVLQHSLRYLGFLSEQYRFDSCFIAHKPYSLEKCFNYFTSLYSGGAREWLVYNIIKENLRSGDPWLSDCIHKTLQAGYVSNPSIKKYLVDIENTNLPGTAAFNFHLQDKEGIVHSLSDLKGKVVLMDFYYIGCGACASLHPRLDSVRDLIHSKYFVIVSICIDYTGASKGYWRPALAKGTYTSEENINLFAEGEKGIDPPITKQYYIKGCPTIILVDKDGKIADQPMDPREDGGKNLIGLIKKYL